MRTAGAFTARCGGGERRAGHVEIKPGADGCETGGVGRSRRPRHRDGVVVGVTAREDDLRTAASIGMDVRLHADLQQMNACSVLRLIFKTFELGRTRLN